MVDLPHEDAPQLVNRRWLAATRVLAAIPVVGVLGFVIWECLPASGKVCSEEVSAVTGLIFLAATLPFVISLAHLLGRTSIRLKKGLAWAVIAGCFWGGIFLVIGLPNALAKSYGEAWWPLLAALVPIALATSAIRTYYSTVREKGDWRILLRGVGWFAVYLVSLFVIVAALPDLLYTAHHNSEVVARLALQKINSAQDTYARTYPQGFSPTLDALGPPRSGAAPGPSAAGLIEADLAHGTHSQYAFRYTHEPPDATGKITRYTVTADPARPECSSWRHYLTDQTGAIHETFENRPATVNDPAF
jgi:type IV pilus assembly protein PilA